MTEQLIILIEIILIDLVLAGDNAIIIGMVASKFEDSNRKKIIFWGIGGAVVLRILFTFITAYLLQISGLRLIAENGYGDEFGIGAEESYTIKEIAELFGGNIEMLPERRGNRLLGEVITEKTKNLGWYQKNSLKDYIKYLITKED